MVNFDILGCFDCRRNSVASSAKMKWMNFARTQEFPPFESYISSVITSNFGYDRPKTERTWPEIDFCLPLKLRHFLCDQSHERIKARWSRGVLTVTTWIINFQIHRQERNFDTKRILLASKSLDLTFWCNWFGDNGPSVQFSPQVHLVGNYPPPPNTKPYFVLEKIYISLIREY